MNLKQFVSMFLESESADMPRTVQEILEDAASSRSNHNYHEKANFIYATFSAKWKYELLQNAKCLCEFSFPIVLEFYNILEDTFARKYFYGRYERKIRSNIEAFIYDNFLSIVSEAIHDESNNDCYYQFYGSEAIKLPIKGRHLRQKLESWEFIPYGVPSFIETGRIDFRVERKSLQEYLDKEFYGIVRLGDFRMYQGDNCSVEMDCSVQFDFDNSDK